MKRRSVSDGLVKKPLKIYALCNDIINTQSVTQSVDSACPNQTVADNIHRIITQSVELPEITENVELPEITENVRLLNIKKEAIEKLLKTEEFVEKAKKHKKKKVVYVSESEDEDN